MIAGWQIQELVHLVQEKYPGWQNFEQAEFVADEIAPKRATAEKARKLLNRGEFKRMLKDGRYDEIISRLEQVGKASNMLWTAQPRNGDLAILYQPELPKWAFCEQMRALLFDQRPSPDRLETFIEFCHDHQLPLRWPFATFFLFIVRPHAEVFVKPSIARWFMRFMGSGEAYTAQPSADMYERYKKSYHGLKAEMVNFEPRDMIDIQSLVWVAASLSRERVSGMDVRMQIELDRPSHLRESDAVYQVDQPPKRSDETTQAPQENKSASDLRSSQPSIAPNYSLTDCARDTGIAAETLQTWVRAIERKGQAVLYGPPGTGKTYVAQHIAQHLTSSEHSLIQTVQFHPAYDYADFIAGIRPQTSQAGDLTYVRQPGVFLRFCQAAAHHSGRCVLIIDEINRANLAQVFGELMYLLEYRSHVIELADGQPFQIPPNVRILGTMNTADRSIALIDHALRRRFAFIHMPPNPDILRHYHRTHTQLNVEPLIALIERVNHAIDDPNFMLGMSYFLTPTLANDIETIWQLEIEPYLEEYFFSHAHQVEAFRWEHVSTDLNDIRR